MKKSPNLAIFPLVLISGTIGMSNLTISHAGSPNTAISVVVLPGEDSCSCGSHMGGLNARYENRKISIGFSHSPNPANPVKHPIVVIKDNRPVRSWDSLICSSSCSAISGSRATIYGRWRKFDGFDFEAYKIVF
jgi:hypothetical protein